MKETTRFNKISPMIAVASMEETLRFYTDILGLSEVMQSETYSVIERDGCSLHLMKAADDHVLECVRGHTQIYIEVTGINALWEKVKAVKQSHKIKDLFEQPYGMREFHIEDPNGCLVFVGELI